MYEPPPFAELHCRSNFTFLVGASQPEELMERAAAKLYSALALTDEARSSWAPGAAARTPGSFSWNAALQTPRGWRTGHAGSTAFQMAGAAWPS
jgi:histidinol phosphatase-like PHP family hydrolase